MIKVNYSQPVSPEEKRNSKVDEINKRWIYESNIYLEMLLMEDFDYGLF